MTVGLTVHVGLSAARAVAALDAVLVARGIHDGCALDVTLAIAGRLARRPALLGIVCSVTARLTRADALAKAVVNARDVDATIAVAFAGHGALVGTGRFGRQRALTPAHRVELGRTRLFEHSQLAAPRLAVQAAPYLTIERIF